MLGNTTPFGPIDLLGALALNTVATNAACKNVAFRVGMAKKGTSDIPAWADYRFLGGIAAAAAGQFLNDPRIQRVGHDVACGLLGSYVATETCRKHAQKVCDNAQAANYFQTTGAAQITDTTTATATAPVKSPNYAYGW